MAASILILLQFASFDGNQAIPSAVQIAKQPLPIRQGPMQTPGSTIEAPQPYWFQQGAMGGNGTQNSVGANITIRTVYDNVNQDAHSYWVGSLLANGAFVQVGYLNGLSTTNQPYCCAWFYEFFPSGNTISPPIIGPEGSVGPIGSMHTYSMISVGNGVWSFYLDGGYLGSSPAPGQPGYLGSTATNTGSYTPGGISEVAQTTTNTDIIGPAEFLNFQYKTTTGPWQQVPTGKVYIYYGANSLRNLPNPYSVAEVEGKTTVADFLSGSYLPKPAPNPNPNPCGNLDSSILWSPTTICRGPTNNVSFSFTDKDGNNLTPFWVSIADATGLEIFYTTYQNQIVPNPNSGQWNFTQIMWHAVNVATGFAFTPSPSAPTETVPTYVFSVQLQVVGLLYSLPVSGASVLVFLPDFTNETSKTDSSGQTILAQLPPATYSLRIRVPDGISTSTSRALSAQSSIVVKVISLPEIVTIIIPPILIAIAIAGVVARREHRRETILPAIPSPLTTPAYCSACGRPLSQGALFCTNCGTPVRTMHW